MIFFTVFMLRSKSHDHWYSSNGHFSKSNSVSVGRGQSSGEWLSRKLGGTNSKCGGW